MESQLPPRTLGRTGGDRSHRRPETETGGPRAWKGCPQVCWWKRQSPGFANPRCLVLGGGEEGREGWVLWGHASSIGTSLRVSLYLAHLQSST